MEFLQKKPVIFRSEVIGYQFIFDCDIEVSVDLSGDIYDYSGCGYERAVKLINENK